MAQLRVVVLWHQHQPFYKDLVTGEYRLPWTRLHALKDYYGMVKLLEEFPNVHQTFNLVPSLITQIQDYVSDEAQDPFLQVAAKPAKDLSPDERRFALQYLFQAHPVNLIGRYPRYRELWERFRSAGEAPERLEKLFQPQDFTDLQVLSQIAWFDEYFLQEKNIADLVRKGRNYSLEDQRFVIATERELLGRVVPVHAEAAKKGLIEISTSPFYHPILPLICDTQIGAVSSPGLPLPQNRYRHPEDAREQLLRGLDFHENTFGTRPRGVWPSEGSVSEEVLAIAHRLGVQWMATDEGVLGRTLGLHFSRDGQGRLSSDMAHRLYTIYRYENADTRMNMIFRDHTLSDLIGFVYSGMPPQDAANNLIHKIKESAQPLLSHGQDALIPIILDGENAWEYYPQSGREFLRRFYDGLSHDPGIESVTVSEAIARHQNCSYLKSLVPGSWINANFNVWIGAPEDNKAWDYLYRARNFYTENAASATEQQRNLAFEEILIAEGSDWNWWYGPEHHSANDRDFDELYRKHLSNVYLALGSTPPEYLAQPIIAVAAAERAYVVPQTAYIHPEIEGTTTRYFDWIGAAMATADRHTSAMHGKEFVLEALRAGIDQQNLYARVDFARDVSHETLELRFQIEGEAGEGTPRRHHLRVTIQDHAITAWSIREEGTTVNSDVSPPELRMNQVFELRVPLTWLGARLDGSRLRLRCSVWRNGVPVDALPVEGSLGLNLVPEEKLEAL